MDSLRFSHLLSSLQGAPLFDVGGGGQQDEIIIEEQDAPLLYGPEEVPVWHPLSAAAPAAFYAPSFTATAAPFASHFARPRTWRSRRIRRVNLSPPPDALLLDDGVRRSWSSRRDDLSEAEDRAFEREDAAAERRAIAREAPLPSSHRRR